MSPVDDENDPPASETPIQEHSEDDEKLVGDLDEDTPTEGSEVVDRDHLLKSLQPSRRLERLGRTFSRKRR